MYAVDALPADFDERAGKFRKHATTRAVRLRGPFIVDTSEGPLECEDGWLALDARGYPYPIAADEFELIYTEAGVGDESIVTLACEPESWWVTSGKHVATHQWFATDRDGNVAQGEKPTLHEAQIAARRFAYRRVSAD